MVMSGLSGSENSKIRVCVYNILQRHRRLDDDDDKEVKGIFFKLSLKSHFVPNAHIPKENTPSPTTNLPTLPKRSSFFETAFESITASPQP